MGENKKGERKMKAMQKMKALRTVFALAAVLAMTGAASAKPSNVGPGIQGDLTPTRDSVTFSVPVDTCTAVANHTYSIKAYIFQPSGRMFAIGITDPPTPFNCLGLAQTVEVTVNAFPGLTFKPGPATVLFQVIDTDNTVPTSPVVIIMDESGSRIDLH